MHNLITLDAKKIRPSHLPIQPYLSLHISLHILISISSIFSRLSLNSGTPSFNQKIIDSTTIPLYFPNPSVPYTPRLYNPLQHQQGQSVGSAQRGACADPKQSSHVILEEKVIMSILHSDCARKNTYHTGFTYPRGTTPNTIIDTLVVIHHSINFSCRIDRGFGTT